MRKSKAYLQSGDEWIDITEQLSGRWKIATNINNRIGIPHMYVGYYIKYLFFFKEHFWASEDCISMDIFEEFENECSNKTM